MKRVLKWAVPVDDLDHPIGAGPVVLVDCLLPNLVNVWTEETQADGRIPLRRVRVFGTGHPIMGGDRHLGSTKHEDTGLVWHVYGTLL